MGSRLVEAREARGFTATRIADLISVKKQSVSQWEHGQQTPHPDHLDRLSAVLNLPKSFFFRKRSPGRERIVFYRSLSSATKSARIRAERRYSWLRDIVTYLEGFFEFPKVSFPSFALPREVTDITDDSIEIIAGECREFWALGNDPVPDITLLLENSGGICSRMAFEADTLDSFSEWALNESRPFFVLGSDKGNAFRSRMDAAHELGHIILHRHISKADFQSSAKFKRVEQQAFRFASAFLLPAEQFCSEIWAPTLDAFLALKPRWKVAVAAMLMRSQQLGIVEGEYARRLWMTLGRYGWKRKEPLDDEEAVERPRLLRRSIEMLLTDGNLSAAQILAYLRLSPLDIEEIANLTQGTLSQERAQVIKLPKFIGREPVQEFDLDDRSNVIPFGRNQRPIID
jgi:Zn-dependent peptidase ImmA (M78 family)/DNA-binding XRE family transcriptional regulator